MRLREKIAGIIINTGQKLAHRLNPHGAVLAVQLRDAIESQPLLAHLALRRLFRCPHHLSIPI